MLLLLETSISAKFTELQRVYRELDGTSPFRFDDPVSIGINETICKKGYK